MNTRAQNARPYLYPARPIPFASARRIVGQYTAIRDGATIDKVAQHMVDTGDCAWHALHVVCATPRCFCSDCRSAAEKQAAALAAARLFAETVIARTDVMDTRDPMRRCLRKHAKAAILIIDDEQRASEKGHTPRAVTVEEIRSWLVDACENAATWYMTAAGRIELDGLVRDA